MASTAGLFVEHQEITPPSNFHHPSDATQTYFADVLTKLVNLWPEARLDELMPWAWAAQQSADRIAAFATPRVNHQEAA